MDRDVDRDQELTQVLVELAHTLGTDCSTESILERLVQRVADMLPVTAAGVMVMGEHDELHFAAASNDTIEQIRLLQDELHEGPCLTAFRTGAAVRYRTCAWTHG